MVKKPSTRLNWRAKAPMPRAKPKAARYRGKRPRGHQEAGVSQGKKGKEVKGDAGETLHEGAQEKLPEKPSSGQAQVLQGA